MNKKGFTLVELLATIVIIALIMTLVMPSATKISKNNKTKIYLEYEKMMIEYAKVSKLNNQNTIDLFDLEELDKIKNECIGYVAINHTTTPYQYSAHISCGDQYTSEVFDSSLARDPNEN